MKSRERKKFRYHHISYCTLYCLLVFIIANQLILFSSSVIVTSTSLGGSLTRLSPSTTSSASSDHNVNVNANSNSNKNTTTKSALIESTAPVSIKKLLNSDLLNDWTYLPNILPPVSTHPYYKPSLYHRPSSNANLNNKNINNNSSSASLTIVSQQHVVASTTSKTSTASNLHYKTKICIGTSGRMSIPQNKESHYQSLRDRYTNCTYVDGNLEITSLQSEVDLSFLNSIREVTGYVLIANVNVQKIKMHNLQIIRGRELFTLSMSDDKFALLVSYSSLRNLEMPKLRDILVGSVGIFESPNMCHIKSIYWDEILSHSEAKTFYYYNNTVPTENCRCTACDECWSEEPQMCQEMNRKHCHPACQRGGCYGSKASECCHAFCAGGCTGPKQSDCLACRNFYDDGVCKQECPPMMRYNVTTFSWEANPEGKYAYGANCVKDCPDHLLRDNGACVKTCPLNKRNQGGECVNCLGPCPKNCQGVDNVNSGNIESFKGCTQIEGSITITDQSFAGYNEVFPNFTIGMKHRALHPSELEVFSTLKEITGFLNIQATHKDFKNLSCFRNLERIEGRQTTDMFTTLNIVKTSLVSLNLRSLKHIRSGKVAIVENPDLCFADTLKWQQIISSGSDVSKEVIIKLNAESNKCKDEGLICHRQCSQDGCWGPRSDECLTCTNFKLDGRCVKDCQTDPISSYDAGNNTCEKCHEECANGCTGPNPNNCRECKNVRDGPYCVRECPISKYNSSGHCSPCHDSCATGCTGPSNKIGPLGCNSCQKAVISSIDTSIMNYCIKSDDQCPMGYYLEHNEARPICRRCHNRCKTCQAMGTHVSVCECSAFEVGENCEDRCPRDYYADGKKCMKCSTSCNGCYGPSEADCLACRHFRVNASSSDNSSHFYCTEKCPIDKPFRVIHNTDFYCSDKDKSLSLELLYDSSMNSTQGIAITLGIVIVSLFLFFVYKCQRVKSEENTAKLTMRMSGFDDDEPLQPSNIEPNLAKLRIIQECELREGKQLGQGSGGIVYQGQWIESENGETLGKNKSIKRLVAIKVLKDEAQPHMNKQFLEEAKLMASVNHPNLVKLLAVCMTSRLMLITELMPLGCLLEYVKDSRNKAYIKPIHLIKWCHQIANGMAYLEKRNIVHRDLALRNVLVQTVNRVLITDFGLAKLLDDGKGEYQSEGGKLPVRWLAPECLQRKIFTHKSDVWAFSVTVWELLTYGKNPYYELETKEVPNRVLSGLRLNQPEQASIDVYLTMTKCWMVQPNDRPTFEELVKEFSKYRRDPCRYLGIPGDKLKRSPSCLKDNDMTNEPIDDLFVTPINSPFLLTPCKNKTFNFTRSPNISMSHDTENMNFCINDNNNNMRKNAMDLNLTINRNKFDSVFETSPYQDGKKFMTEFDYHSNHNFSFPRTPIKTTPPCDDLNLPVDDDDYLLPSPSFIDASDTTMNIIPIDLNGVNNLEYHLKYNYINQEQDPLNCFSRRSTSDDMSFSDQISDSNSLTKPDETTV